MNTNTKKIGFVVIIAITLLISILFINQQYTANQEQPDTGGSGKIDSGYLILSGYETPSNDSSRIPLGEFLMTEQQTNIRSVLEVLLYKENPQQEYRGNIKQGSVDVNYRTNVVTFKIDIEKPEVTYEVHYNITTNEIQVFGKDGQLLDPTK